VEVESAKYALAVRAHAALHQVEALAAGLALGRHLRGKEEAELSHRAD
jgi:hypothetical protein